MNNMPSPIKVIDGIVFHDPIVEEMNGETGEVKPFNVEGRDRRELVNVVDFDGSINVKAMGEYRLDDLYKAIQGDQNKGFPRIYIFPTGRVEEW